MLIGPGLGGLLVFFVGVSSTALFVTAGYESTRGAHRRHAAVDPPLA